MDFVWKCQPQAERYVENLLDQYCASNPDLMIFKNELSKHASTRLFDLTDYIVCKHSEEIELELKSLGFEQNITRSSYRVFHHPEAQLPRVVLDDNGSDVTVGAAISVENIADFLCVRGMSRHIEGGLLSPFRRCLISNINETSFWIIERRGTAQIEPQYLSEEYLENYLKGLELWLTRPRDLEDEDLCFKMTLDIANKLVLLVGQDVAAAIVLQGERQYWQSRNLPGQLQKNRQDRIGIGWANHDHHTFRSSRKHFTQLVRLFEILGFHCRERFYAGDEAGWGAQVMENPRGKFVLFLDVDLGPEEIQGDFAHEPFRAESSLGTIGLWCGLHGDSILQAGMHHLEAQFIFDDLKNELASMGIQMMDPFSNFPYLKQAFTRGEAWHVNPKRVQKLLAEGLITHAQADQFLTHGAIGSHLENLQRKEGFKGFNQKNVSKIIKSTDPRTQTVNLQGA